MVKPLKFDPPRFCSNCRERIWEGFVIRDKLLRVIKVLCAGCLRDERGGR